jgi:hypothetical protein
MSEEEEDIEDYDEEPATTNLNKFFKSFDEAPPKVGKKRSKPEEVEPVEAQEEFRESAKKYARYEEKKEDDVTSVIRFATTSMIRGIDIALGYDGSAVKILDEPSVSEALDTMLVKDFNTRDLVRSYKKYMPFVAMAGILLSYHSYRSEWASVLEKRIENNPQEIQQKISSVSTGTDENTTFMRDFLEKK